MEIPATVRLWATAECRERWCNALRASPSSAVVALCARQLRGHADAFSAAAGKKRSNDLISFELESWYHAGAFVVKERPVGRRKRRKFA